MLMLRFLIISCIVLAALACAFAAGIAASEFKHSSYYKFRNLIYYIFNIEPEPSSYATYYHEKLSLYNEDTRNNYDAVFIGDSLTDGADWQSFFEHLNIANRGINGDITKGITQRMGSITNTGAKHAFIMVGVNDVRRGFDMAVIIDNYQSILKQLLANNMQVFLQSTVLTNYPESNIGINRLNDELQQIARDNENIIFVDLNGALAPGGILNAEYTLDGIHLNGKGYAQWQNVLRPILRDIKSHHR